MSTDGINAPLALPDQGIVYVCGEIDEELTAKVILAILGRGSGELITVYIGSEGGSVYDALAIMQAIKVKQAQGCQVRGEVLGYAFSSASMILMACSPRIMHRDAWLGIHGMTSGQMGDMQNLEADHAHNRALVEQQARLYTEHSNVDYETWFRVLQARTVQYYSAEDALSANLIDEVV